MEQIPNADLVVLGEKSKAQLSRSSGKHIKLSFAGVGKDVPTFADAQAIADQISLLPEDYGDIQILYNRFINATSYEATPIEAFSEEAIKNSRMLILHQRNRSIGGVLIGVQQTLRPSRLMMKLSAILENMLSPTRCTGLWPKVTLVSNQLAGMLWT